MAACRPVWLCVCTMCQGSASVHERHHGHRPDLAVSTDTADVRVGSVLGRDTMFAEWSAGLSDLSHMQQRSQANDVM